METRSQAAAREALAYLAANRGEDVVHLWLNPLECVTARRERVGPPSVVYVRAGERPDVMWLKEKDARALWVQALSVSR